MTRATMCLWIPTEQVDHALAFYTGLTAGSRIIDDVTLDGADGNTGARIAAFEIAGQRFEILGAPRQSPFTDAASILLVVDDQQQLDEVWDAILAGGGSEVACGWIRDGFGVSWQIVPQVFYDHAFSGDQDRAQRAAEAVWRMGRLDAAEIDREARADS